MDYFNLKFHKTTVKNEIFAGITLFMAMSYILVVCPTVLAQAGMSYNGVFLATVLVSGFATIVSAFYTKLPIALAPGLGMTSIFLNFATGEQSVHWSCLLLATYAAGILICGFIRFGIYDKIMEIMDEEFRRMIMSGVGMALLLYGVSTTGLLEKKNGFYAIGSPDIISVGICVASLAVIYRLNRAKKKGAVLIGVLVAYCLSIGVNYYNAYHDSGISVLAYAKEVFGFSYEIREIGEVMFAFPDVVALFSKAENAIIFANAVFVFTMGHFFDAIGTNTSSFDAINSDIDLRIKDTVSLKRAITVDGVGSVGSGLLGTASVTTYAESLVGIVSGGKTGITALTTGILFLMCFFLAPLFTSMATYVAAPALIYVGIALVMRFLEMDKSKTMAWILGVGIIAYVGISFNIGNAVLYGLIIYNGVQLWMEKRKPAAGWWIMLGFAVVHILLNLI